MAESLSVIKQRAITEVLEKEGLSAGLASLATSCLGMLAKPLMPGSISAPEEEGKKTKRTEKGSADMSPDVRSFSGRILRPSEELATLSTSCLGLLAKPLTPGNISALREKNCRR